MYHRHFIISTQLITSPHSKTTTTEPNKQHQQHSTTTMTTTTTRSTTLNNNTEGNSVCITHPDPIAVRTNVRVKAYTGKFSTLEPLPPTIIEGLREIIPLLYRVPILRSLKKPYIAKAVLVCCSKTNRARGTVTHEDEVSQWLSSRPR
jgi:hypothetical protein